MAKALSGLNISVFNSDIHSQFWDQPIDRKSLRQQIVNQFADKLSIEETQNILNLNCLPKSQSLFFSISHSPAGSGFVAYHKPVGLDIEKNNRTQKLSLIQRVSSNQEVELFEDNWFLIWSIKEAAFKRLSQHKPDLQLISKLNIQSLFDQQQNQLKTKINYQETDVTCHCVWNEDKVICICT